MVTFYDNAIQIVGVSGILYPFYAILAIGLIFIFYGTFNVFWEFIEYLGKFDANSRGMERVKYRSKIIGCYIILTIPTYIAILSLIQLSNPTILDYALIFPIMISFLVSLRIAANPTKKVYRLFNKLNCKPAIPDEFFHDNPAFKTIKDQVTSFYFAIIEGAIFVDAMIFIIPDLRARLIQNLGGILTLFQRDLIILIIAFIVAYLFALLILGFFTEWFLYWAEVIDPN